MTAPHGSHDPGDLGALALGLLDGHEARSVLDRVERCPECHREYAALAGTAQALGTVPPESFLDGPPDSDLLVARTARAVRAEGARTRRRRSVALVAAAVVTAVALLGGGVLLGRAAAPTTSTSAAGAVTVEGTEGGVAMSATLVPAAGWVRVATTVRGIPAGTRCTILVIGDDGTENVAGSWLASPRGQVDGTSVDGAAIVDPERVLSVVVRDERGTDLIALPA